MASVVARAAAAVPRRTRDSVGRIGKGAKHIVRKKAVTQKDLARQLGVSQMTISRVRNGVPGVSKKLRETIQSAMQRHDYVRDRVAARLRGAPGKVIGLVIPDIHCSFFPDLVSGIQRAADGEGYVLLLAYSRETYEDEVREIDKLREFQVDGMIIAPSGSARQADVYRRLLSSGPPFVFMDRRKPGVACSSVVSDTRGGAKKLGEYLAQRGYRRWGYLSGPRGISSSIEHAEGLRAAFAAAGLAAGDFKAVEAGFYEDGGYEATQRLLACFKPDVIVGVTDAAALGAFRLLRERGLSVPGDIALAGFSNFHDSDLLAVPLTTVREHTEDMGPRAFALLSQHLKNPDARPARVRLPTELVIRASA